MIDIKKIRSDFPIFDFYKDRSFIYLDSAATSLKPKIVADRVYEYYTKYTANTARGDYDLGAYVTDEFEKTREKVAKFINADTREIIFTSGTTSSINLIATGFANEYLTSDDEILLTEAEHASNVLPWFAVSKKTGCSIKYIPLDKNGMLTIESFKKVLTSKTKIVALAQVTNVLGYLVDIKEIAKTIRENVKDCYLVVDGAQSVPHIKVDVKDLDCDFLSFSSHKMLGPTGLGVLYGKYDVLKKLQPQSFGGGMNSRYDTCGNVLLSSIPYRFESGTMMIEAVLGFSKALDYLNEIGMNNIKEYVNDLHNYAIKKLKEIKEVVIYNEHSDTGIITFNYNGVFAQDLATHYNSYGISVRSGQHCAKILMDFLKTQATVRMSLYLYNTKEEIDKFIEVTKKAEEYLNVYL